MVGGGGSLITDDSHPANVDQAATCSSHHLEARLGQFYTKQRTVGSLHSGGVPAGITQSPGWKRHNWRSLLVHGLLSGLKRLLPSTWYSFLATADCHALYTGRLHTVLHLLIQHPFHRHPEVDFTNLSMQGPKAPGNKVSTRPVRAVPGSRLASCRRGMPLKCPN